MSKECVLSPQRLIVQQAIDFLTLYISPLLIGGQWRLLSGKEGVCGFKPLVLIASTICLAYMTHCQGILSTHTFKHAFMHIHAHKGPGWYFSAESLNICTSASTRSG